MLPGLDGGRCIPPDTWEKEGGSINIGPGAEAGRVDGVSGIVPIVGAEDLTEDTSVSSDSELCPLLL